MELNSIQLKFNELVDKGLTPSIIKRKMALTLEQWQSLSKDYEKFQEFKVEELRKIEEANMTTVDQLANMWKQIEKICFELRIEKDYEIIYTLERELEDLSIKYSESQFKKST